MSKTVDEMKAELAALDPTPVSNTNQPVEQDNSDRKKYEEYCAWSARQAYYTPTPTFEQWKLVGQALRDLETGKLVLT